VKTTPVSPERPLTPRSARGHGIAVACFSVGFLWGGRAAAQESPHAAGRHGDGSELHGIAALAFGKGLRFNNPYRLATPLGDTAESVSLSATYLDLGLGVLWVNGESLLHGAALSAVVALDGISQLGVTPSYLTLLALTPALALRGRLGIPIVITPDTTVGLEAALGSRFAVALGLAVTAELVGDVFFGAATEERSVTTIPMLSLQLGVQFEHAMHL
jgi:hypothetical protein